MKKIFSICICAIIINMALWAQDIIITNNSQKIEAKILEVSKTEIKYKELDNIDGPTFVIETNDINSIIYSNGKVVLYQQPTEVKQESSKAVEEDKELQEWIQESDRQAQAKAQRSLQQQQEQERKELEKALERQRTQEMLANSQKQLEKSLEDLGNSIRDYRRVKNSYVVEIYNSTKYPYKIILDGHILGIVNGYKVGRFLVPVEWYGRMQAVQTSGYRFSPTIKEYRILPQKKETKVSFKIQ